MKTYGLIGFPLIHSFSHNFFTEKFEKERLDAEYLNFEIPKIEDFPKIITNYPNLCGLNVTIPYKQEIIPYLNEIAAAANAIGAVNVIQITQKDGKPWLKGFNSDVIGFVHSILPLLNPNNRRALILGTGGASRAICYVLSNLSIHTVLVSRTPRIGMLGYGDLNEEIMKRFKVIINCSPVGTFPNIDECPQIPYQFIGQDHILFDLVYNPDKSLFLQKGEAQGAKIKNGLEMLHRQADASWEFWNSTK